jgi:hypothetical protein
MVSSPLSLTARCDTISLDVSSQPAQQSQVLLWNGNDGDLRLVNKELKEHEMARTWFAKAIDNLELSGSHPRLNSPSTLGSHLSLGQSVARQHATGTSLFSTFHTVTASGPAAANKEPSGEKAIFHACVSSVVGSLLTALNGSLASHIRTAPDMAQVARRTAGTEDPFVRALVAVRKRKSRSVGYWSGYSWICRLIESLGCKSPK